MPQIPVQMLQAGMTTASDVQNKRGQVLIPGGVPITERHLRGMKIWGIESIDIQSDGLDDALLAQTEPQPEKPADDEIEAFLAGLFKYNTDVMAHPFMVELYALCRTVFSQQGIPRSTLTTDLTAARPSQRDSEQTEGDGSYKKKEMLSTAELLKNSKNLASPPDIYARLMEAMERSGSSSATMATVIENDPGLTARLLRIVNSAFYSFPSPIETISRAVTIVGTDELRTMVLVTSVIKKFSKGLDGVLDMEQFWRHSIASALFSKQIAILRNDQNAERFFTTGLLHDIGRLIMYLQMPDEMAALLHDNGSDKDLYRKERQIFGFTHAQMGKELADSWRLSPRQSEAIQFHHSPQGAKRFPADTAILHISDVLANALKIGSSGSAGIPQFFPDALDKVRLRPGALARLHQDVEREVSELIQIFYENKP
ncbi:MAG: HDOD domain-containing protein [Deltaproteobacteria bacterium]|nr:HDOD domain-containing protein [Deltaproteobacteria bacterium]